MILGYGYDSSLWLLMKNDKVNRKAIVEFIRNIPEELYLDIKDKLSTINDYREGKIKVVDKNKVYDFGSFRKEDKVYYYKINLYNYGLTLGFGVFNGLSYNKRFEINLYPSNNLENNEEYTFIGSIQPCCNYYGITKKLFICDRIFFKTPYRFMELHSSLSEKTNIGIVNVNRIPKELDYGDLYKLNTLVRGKRLK